MSLARFLPFLAAALAVACLASPAPAQRLLSDGDEAIWRAAFAEGRADRWAQARSLAERADDPTLARVLLWMELKDSGRPTAFAPLARFLLDNPRWPGRAALRERAEAAAPDDLGAAEAAAFFDVLPPRTGDGAARYIDALFALGRDADARAEIDRAWIGLGFSRAGERAFLDAHGARMSEDLHWRRIDRLLWRGETGAAKRLLALVGDDRRRLARARILLRDGSPGVDAAIRAVPERLRDDAGLVYERARWRIARAPLASALEMLLRAPRDPAHADLWARQRLKFARRAMDEGDRPAAYRALDGHRLRGAFHHEVDWLAGWLALRELGDPAAALERFAAFHGKVRFPISKARGAYWAGRAAEETGKPELAAAWYGLAAANGQTFYGQLGAERIGLAPRLPEPPAIAEEDVRAFEDDELTAVARRLHEIGEDELVRVFLLRMAGEDAPAARHELVGRLALAMDRPDIAVAAAKRALESSGATPIETGHPVVDLPSGGDVEPALALAVIRQESAFDPAALSPAGARGLMQLMPATAREVAGKLGVATSGDRLLSDPEHNMRLGMAYLGLMLDLHDGSLAAAVASYNAGPRRVRRWIADGMGRPGDSGVDLVDWIEEIPFSETRNYVQRVIESMKVYRMLSGARTVDLASFEARP